MNNQALAKSNSGPIAQITDEERELTGIDKLDRNDQILPRLALVQPTSRLEDAEPGKFHNSVLGTYIPEFDAVLLRVQKQRVYWPAEYSAEQDPLCASDDAIRARDGFTEFGPDCATCPMSPWVRNEDESESPPPCSLVYSYLIFDTDAGMPSIISLMRTSARTARQLNALFGAFSFSHQFHFKSELVVNDKGKFFEWRVSDAGQVDRETYLNIARRLAGKQIQVDTGPQEQEIPF